MELSVLTNMVEKNKSRVDAVDKLVRAILSDFEK